MHTPDVRAAARALGGVVSGGQIRCPGPGHSAKDRSLIVWFDPDAPDGFSIHSHAGDDWKECKDYVRQKVGFDAFKPSGGNGKTASDHLKNMGARARANSYDFNDAPSQDEIAWTKKRNGHASSIGGGKVVATYDYTDAAGTLLYQKLRYEPKGFSQRRPDGKGGWLTKLGDVRRVPYRLPGLAQHADGTVFVCEGEKDADRVASLGICATSVDSGHWNDETAAVLAGRDCLVLEDKDEKGRKRALEAARALHGHAKSVRIVRLPGLAEDGDVSDWLDADPDRGADELAEICFDAPLIHVAVIDRDDKSAAMKLALEIGRGLQRKCFMKGLLTENEKLYRRIMAAENKHLAASRAGFKQADWSPGQCVFAGGWLLSCAYKLGVFERDEDGLPRTADEYKDSIDTLASRPATEPLQPWTGWRRGPTTFVKGGHPDTKKAIETAFRKLTMQEHVSGVNRLEAVPYTINAAMIEVVERFAGIEDENEKGVGANGRAGRVAANKVAVGKRVSKEIVAIDIATAKPLVGERFYIAHACDWRGRVYGVPHFNFQREDHGRECRLGKTPHG
jgi:hypothetical protein